MQKMGPQPFAFTLRFFCLHEFFIKEASYDARISYNSKNADATAVTSSTTTWRNVWYVVNKKLTVSGCITV